MMITMTSFAVKQMIIESRNASVLYLLLSVIQSRSVQLLTKRAFDKDRTDAKVAGKIHAFFVVGKAFRICISANAGKTMIIAFGSDIGLVSSRFSPLPKFRDGGSQMTRSRKLILLRGFMTRKFISPITKRNVPWVVL